MFIVSELANPCPCRECPGLHFADAALFINIALVLHVFNITSPVDENGREIKIEPRMVDSFVS